MLGFLKKRKGGFSEMDNFFFTKFCDNLINGISFSLARFGDGEWNAIFHSDGQNCDGHAYFPDMGDALKGIVSREVGYYVGIQPMTVRNTLMEVGRVSFAVHNRYFNADIFHKASQLGRSGEFFNALSQRRVILIGPAYLSALTHVSLAAHVVIPEKDCWLEKDRILTETKSVLSDHGDVVLLCASMAANVLVDTLHNQYGTRHSFLDIGSLLDPFAGRITRSYHKKLNISK